MTINHPDIALYGTDETARRQRMVRDLELFLSTALLENPHPNPVPEYRARGPHTVYSPAITAAPEDPRC